MNVLETYAIGSSKLTYDLIEKILKSNARLTLSVQAREKIRLAAIFWIARQKRVPNRYMASRRALALCAISIYRPMNFLPFRKIL